MRKLASIKKISAIDPIPGKDRIELATVDGWTVIVKKNEYKVGDLCVYVEIDSVLPDRPEFDFLRGKDFRIKTMKMAGCISQGICFPINILPTGDYTEGQDVTDVLGITKWERSDATDTTDTGGVKPVQKKSKFPKFLMRMKWFRKLVSKGKHTENQNFPAFLSKTDETRIQNAPFYLEKDMKWVVTEKIDGQSGTFALVKHKRFLLPDKYEYIVCSRNRRLKGEDGSSYWSVSKRYGISDALRKLMDVRNADWVAIQGECIAPKVQGNKYKVTEPDLYVFNVILPSGRLGSFEARDAATFMGLKFVPILGYKYLPKTVPEMLEYAHGESILGNTLREGLVCRSADGKQSWKAVDPLFLLKYDE